MITQRVVAAPSFSTTESTIRLPTYASPSGNSALTSVKLAIATVPPRADFHTRPRARGVYSKLPRSAALHDGARELLGVEGPCGRVRAGRAPQLASQALRTQRGRDATRDSPPMAL